MGILMSSSKKMSSVDTLTDAMAANSANSANPDSTRLVSLLSRMAGGDQAALSLFYDLTLSRTYGLALRITRRHDIAEDVCVETYWQVWRESLRYDETRGHPLAWLMVMARSRALDALRRLDQADSSPDPETLIEGDSSPDGSALDQMLCAERDHALRQALDTLTPIQRQMIALAYFRDLSHQEISSHTGLPLGTVKSHLKRAQAGLRTTLERLAK
jgi:RNA polymerase sigma-70 factor (ECF subfamily)